MMALFPRSFFYTRHEIRARTPENVFAVRVCLYSIVFSVSSDYFPKGFPLSVFIRSFDPVSEMPWQPDTFSHAARGLLFHIHLLPVGDG